MLYHRAYGRDLETLVVAVIDNRRPMLSLMRGMLAAIGVGRIEARECPTEAFAAMSLAVPDLVIAASSMQPLTGAALVKVMRHALSGPLSLVPAMIMSARGRPALVEESLRAGAHQVLVLPVSASTLYRRIDWLINDDRPFELKGDYYVVAGLEERLSLSVQRPAYVPEERGLPLSPSPDLRNRQEGARRAELATPWTGGHLRPIVRPAKQ
jgi:DNA-binding NarL/FixJ family response regulator